MRSKKAQGGSGVKLLIYAAIGVIILFIAYLMITSWGKKSNAPASSLNSCTDPLVGEPGNCDCYFNSRCPAGSEGRVHTGCPNTGRYGACNDVDSYINAMKRANAGYEADMAALGASAGADMKRAVQSKHYGQCCAGAELPNAPR